MTTSQEPGGASRGTEPMLVRFMRDDMASTPAGRGGEVWFNPATPGIGAAGCPGDNIVADWDRAMAALDTARHKSENYELRAKAAEATLEKVRADAIEGLDTIGLTGREQAQDTLAILDGKTP